MRFQSSLGPRSTSGIHDALFRLQLTQPVHQLGWQWSAAYDFQELRTSAADWHFSQDLH